MVNDIIFERNVFKKKFKKDAMTNSTVNNNSTNPSTVNVVRKALKIPTNFDSITAKQIANYKHSKAQEMFKERNKKFVDEEASKGSKRFFCLINSEICAWCPERVRANFSGHGLVFRSRVPNLDSFVPSGLFSDMANPEESARLWSGSAYKSATDFGKIDLAAHYNNFIDSNNGHSGCPIDFLEDVASQRIGNNFEHRHESPISMSSGPSFMFPVPPMHLLESFGSYGPIPSFNPHIPPPNPFMPMRSTNTSPNDFQPNNNVAVPPSKSPPPTDSSSVKNNKRIAENKSVGNKIVKQEAEEVPANTEDDIPSFQSPPDIVNGQKIKTAEEFSEDEKNKKKQALLWSLCQEELTVQSSIANGSKKIEGIRKKIDTYHHALSNEEIKLQELKLKAEQLAERRKELLMSTGD
ncbi:unnamed protein product [Meloidogyne enterolobii]|uniref:Uncharacterized protein n=1 Tax=Meloidogyne enterolobii TaxID=390850 RepID=A0ACB1B0Q3_MELEN